MGSTIENRSTKRNGNLELTISIKDIFENDRNRRRRKIEILFRKIIIIIYY